MYFLQISDIHISKFQDRSRITELREFCELTIPTINPKVVLASGDLTDAKTEDHIGSRQFEEEWKYYSAVLRECRINEKTKWLDIRGNHGIIQTLLLSIYSEIPHTRSYFPVT